LLNLGLPLATAVPQLAGAGGVPRAYLRVLVFNENSVLHATHTQQLTSAAPGDFLVINTVGPENVGGPLDAAT